MSRRRPAPDGKLGSWPAARVIGGRLTPIFSLEFARWLAAHANVTVAQACGVHPGTVTRWRRVAECQGVSEEGRALLADAARATVATRKPRTLPPKSRRVEIARKAAAARHRKD